MLNESIESERCIGLRLEDGAQHRSSVFDNRYSFLGAPAMRRTTFTWGLFG
jgi:hypothetical protein